MAGVGYEREAGFIFEIHALYARQSAFCALRLFIQNEAKIFRASGEGFFADFRDVFAGKNALYVLCVLKRVCVTGTPSYVSGTR